jgi:hypothetical protein
VPGVILQDEEMYVVEDAIADSEDMDGGGCVSKLTALSAQMEPSGLECIS